MVFFFSSMAGCCCVVVMLMVLLANAIDCLRTAETPVAVGGEGYLFDLFADADADAYATM